MGRPLRADGRQRRQAILAAALELFADRGYFGTSLRDIATAVGVRESALYNYFPSKEALFVALMEAAQEQKAEQLAVLIDQPLSDVRAVLERLATSLLDGFSAPDQQCLFRVLMSDGIRLAREGRINLMERMTSRGDHLRTLMRRLMAAGGLRTNDPELLAMAFMAPLLLWRHYHAVVPDTPVVVNRKAFIRDHVNQFLQGAQADVKVTSPRPTTRQITTAARARTRRRRPRPRG